VYIIGKELIEEKKPDKGWKIWYIDFVSQIMKSTGTISFLY